MPLQEKQLDPALLDAVDVFGGLDPSGKDEALAAAHWRKLETGERAFEQDQEADAFYVLSAGRLKVTQVTPEGQEIIIRYIGPKEMFGCVAVCGGLTYPGTATAVTDSWALGWTRATIGALAQTYPGIALNAMRTMGGRLQDTQSRLREMQTERVERRIAHGIARLVAQAGRRVEGGKHRVKEGSLPVHVEAATVLVLVVVLLILPLGEVELGVVSGRLIGARAGAAELGVEEPGNGEGGVADDFGREAETGATGEELITRVFFKAEGVGDGGLAVGVG